MGLRSKAGIRPFFALLACLFAALVTAPASAFAAPKNITLTATTTTLNAQLSGPGQHAGKVVNFTANGVVLGSATSNQSGLATILLSALTPPGVASRSGARAQSISANMKTTAP